MTLGKLLNLSAPHYVLHQRPLFVLGKAVSFQPLLGHIRMGLLAWTPSLPRDKESTQPAWAYQLVQEYLALSQAQRVLLCSAEACRSMALRHVPRFQYFRLLKWVGGVLQHNRPVSAHRHLLAEG